MRIEVDGKKWFDDRAACVLVGNVETSSGHLGVPDATPTTASSTSA
jgi:hypothetical protein